MKQHKKVYALTLAAVLIFAGCGKLPAIQSTSAQSADEPSLGQSVSEPVLPDEPNIQVQMTSGPYKKLEVVMVAGGPLYKEPSTDSEVLLDLFDGLNQNPVRIAKKDGWSQCAFGDVIGWVPEDRVNERWTDEEAFPDFLSEELQLLFLKARNLYDVYYPGMQSTGTGYGSWNHLMEDSDPYSEDCVYATKQEWTEALNQVFAPEIVDEIVNMGQDVHWPMWKEKDGRIYFLQGDRGSFCPEVRFRLMECTEDRVLIEASAEWSEQQPCRPTAPIELQKGPDGWRVTKFITDRDEWTWQQRYEQMLEQYKQEEIQNAPKDENGDPTGVLYSPAFLSDEQKAVYEEGVRIYESIPYPQALDYGFTAPEGEEGFVWIDDEQWQLYSPGYEAWMQKFREVFSPKCVKKFENSGVYRDWDGKLAVAPINRAMAEGWTRQMEFCPDQFELISKTDQEVEFKLIAHYEKFDDAGSTEYTKDYPIRLVNTPDGWRVDEIHTALWQ